mgnify:CR=1 FL=1
MSKLICSLILIRWRRLVLIWSLERFKGDGIDEKTLKFSLFLSWLEVNISFFGFLFIIIHWYHHVVSVIFGGFKSNVQNIIMMLICELEGRELCCEGLRFLASLINAFILWCGLLFFGNRKSKFPELISSWAKIPKFFRDTLNFIYFF